MIPEETIAHIKQASIPERIRVIELLLKSLKTDIQSPTCNPDHLKSQRFKVRGFNLGRDISVDRNMIYGERVL